MRLELDVGGICSTPVGLRELSETYSFFMLFCLD